MFKTGFLTSEQTWILLGIPIIFIIGSLMHFVYEWSGNSLIVGIFAPVNESVWEHLKLAYWPMLFWWILGYFIFENSVSANEWFVSCAAAILVSVLVILSFYYTYTGSFGIESLILDIFSFFLGITVGQVSALYLYNNYGKFSTPWLYWAFAVLVILGLAFIIFTFIPPHIPLFKNSPAGK